MTGLVLRGGGLVAIYLLVLTSLAPGDVLVGSVLAALLLASGRHGHHGATTSLGRWVAATVRMIVVTAWEIAVGTVRVVRFCLGGSGTPGFVEIPRGDRSRHGVALWGVLTGEAPDEYPVVVDDGRDVLIVHNVDARDPVAIQARHAAAREQYQRDVVA